MLAHALARAQPPLLALAALIAVAQVGCRGMAFRTLMLPVTRLPWFRALRYALVAAATSSLAPGRAGDVLRTYLLRRDRDVPIISTAAVTVVDKIVDLTAMFMVLAPVPWLLSDLPSWVGRALLGLAGLAAVLVAIASVIAARKPTSRWFTALLAGLAIMRRPSLLVWALLLAGLAWLLDFTCILVVMRAVGIAVPAPVGLLVLLAVNLAIAVPVVPANLGAVELAVLAILRPFGVPMELGLAFALLYHLAQVLPIAGLALIDYRFMAKRSSQSRS